MISCLKCSINLDDPLHKHCVFPSYFLFLKLCISHILSFNVLSGDVDMYDVEINAACGNLDLQTKSIYTTSCHDRMYRHGYICQYNGKSSN